MTDNLIEEIDAAIKQAEQQIEQQNALGHELVSEGFALPVLRKCRDRLRWVPVSERLPSDVEACLVCHLETGPNAYKYGSPSSWDQTLCLAWYDDRDGNWNYEDPDICDTPIMDPQPTHWFDLPQPPQQSEQEGGE